MTDRILLIANPDAAAGRASNRWEQLLAAFRSRQLAPDFVVTQRPRHSVDLAREAASKYRLVVAVGGDGTVNEVATGLLLTGGATPMGVVPFGTGNDVANLLGIRSIEESVDAIQRGETRAIDVIELNFGEGEKPVTRYALLYASVGFAGELLKLTTPAIKRVFGPRYCYSIGFFRALLAFDAPQMRIRCDADPVEGRMLIVSAGNAEIVGSGTMRLSPGAVVDDGLLNVNIVEALDRVEIARWFPRLLKGTHVHHPRVRYRTAKRLEVESNPVMDVQMDGEVFGRTPVIFQVRPRALRVVIGVRGAPEIGLSSAN
jgi:diacylglycerol kinase (ATP)